MFFNFKLFNILSILILIKFNLIRFTSLTTFAFMLQSLRISNLCVCLNFILNMIRFFHFALLNIFIFCLTAICASLKSAYIILLSFLAILTNVRVYFLRLLNWNCVIAKIIIPWYCFFLTFKSIFCIRRMLCIFFS